MNHSPIRRLMARTAAIVGIGSAFALQFVSKGAHAQSKALQNLNASLGATSSAAGIQTTKDLATLVGSFIAAALGLLGVVLVVLIVYAGFIWMTAQGNEEKIKKAKGMITSAVIGIIIIFAAYAITQFVVGALSTSI